MCPVFFAASWHNYARWITKCRLNLLKIVVTHPGARKMLKTKGCQLKNIKRLSHVPVDMMLEQTVNAVAASRLTRISSITQSESARKRWVIIQAMRSSVVGYLLGMAGLQQKEGVSKECKASRIQRDQHDVDQVTNGIESSLNPFKEENIDSQLYCISTGKAVSHKIYSGVRKKVRNGTITSETVFHWSKPFWETNSTTNDKELCSCRARIENPHQRQEDLLLPCLLTCLGGCYFLPHQLVWIWKTYSGIRWHLV